MRKIFIAFLSPFILFSLTALADTTESYKGTAYNKKNKVVYIENHQVRFASDGKAISAKTSYLNPKGKVIGQLDSDFSSSISAPTYNYKDFRHKSGHGIEYIDSKLVLIKYLKSGDKKTKILDEKFPKNSLIIGGQGMHYYLVSNFNRLKQLKNIPVKFLTPGNLNYYNFELNYIGLNKDNLIELKVKISNFFLSFFAPELSIFYHPKTKKLMRYEGLSNISNDEDKNQAVTILYKYN